jgi:hypothetical protein
VEVVWGVSEFETEDEKTNTYKREFMFLDGIHITVTVDRSGSPPSAIVDMSGLLRLPSFARASRSLERTHILKFEVQQGLCSKQIDFFQLFIYNLLELIVLYIVRFDYAYYVYERISTSI